MRHNSGCAPNTDSGFGSEPVGAQGCGDGVVGVDEDLLGHTVRARFDPQCIWSRPVSQVAQRVDNVLVTVFEGS